MLWFTSTASRFFFLLELSNGTPVDYANLKKCNIIVMTQVFWTAAQGYIMSTRCKSPKCSNKNGLITRKKLKRKTTLLNFFMVQCRARTFYFKMKLPPIILSTPMWQITLKRSHLWNYRGFGTIQASLKQI